MAQEKVLGDQLNIQDVASAIGNDQSASSALQGGIDHTQIQNIGTNSHLDLDDHIAGTNPVLYHSAAVTTFDNTVIGGTSSDVQQAINYLYNDTIALRETSTTGNITGVVVTKVTNTTVDITAGTGEIIDGYTDRNNPVKSDVSWSSTSGFIIDMPDSVGTQVLYVDNTNTILQRSGSLTATERRTVIQLAFVYYHHGVIEKITPAGAYTNEIGNTLYDLIAFTNPENRIQGMGINPTTATLNIWASAGKLLSPGTNVASSLTDPNILDFPQVGDAATAITFDSVFSDGSTHVTNGTLIPNAYESAPNTATTLTGTEATIHYIFRTLGNTFFLQLGNTVYPTAKIARASLETDYASFVPFINGGAILSAQIYNQNGVTDFTNSNLAGIHNFNGVGAGSLDVNDYLSLNDVTSATFVGQAGKVAAVNATETGLEFIVPAAGGGSVNNPMTANLNTNGYSIETLAGAANTDNIIITTGSTTSADTREYAGSINLKAGNALSNPGHVNLYGGNCTGSGYGGNIKIIPGTSSTGIAGQFIISPPGAGTGTGAIVLDNSIGSTTITASITGTNIIFKLPPTLGTTGDVLTAQGGGDTAWAPVTGGGGVTNPLTADLDTGGFNIITPAVSGSTLSSAQYINIFGGSNASTVGGYYAGGINVYGGNGTNGNSGGPVYIAGGSSDTYYGGKVNIYAGYSIGYKGGAVTIRGGNSGAGTGDGYNGGDIILVPGTGGGSLGVTGSIKLNGTLDVGTQLIYSAGLVEIVTGAAPIIDPTNNSIVLSAEHGVELYGPTGIALTPGSTGVSGDVNIINGDGTAANLVLHNGTFATTISPAATGSPPTSFVLPPTDGNVGEVLTAQGTGITSWATPTGAAILNDLTDVTITALASTHALITDDGITFINRSLTNADVGLGNVDNTADIDKPISTATQTALDLKTDSVGTTVIDNIVTFIDVSGGQKDSGVAIASLAPLASPAFTGTPTAPTAAAPTNDTQLATTAFVTTAVLNITPTDLGYTAATGNGIVTNTTGTDATLLAADATNAGLLLPAHFTQLSTLSSDLNAKENSLGTPTNDGDVLSSTIAGVRSWITPVAALNDLTDVVLTTSAISQVMQYNGSNWVNVALPASSVVNTPSGGIAATTVQAAIDELDTEKAPLVSPVFTGVPVMSTHTVSTLPTVVEAGYIYVSDSTAASSGIGSQCFGRSTGSPPTLEWIDVTTGIAVV